MENLGEAFGIDITGLYATCECEGHALASSNYRVKINFDIISLDNGKLKPRFVIHANAYNSAGQLLGTVSSYRYSSANYFMGDCPGFASVTINFIGKLDQEPANIRLSVTANSNSKLKRQ